MNPLSSTDAHAIRQPARRAGMTLVELLVVIGIIAVLMTLLLPAVNAVVESSRRSSCLNNEKQIAQAAAQYAAANRQLPGWRNEVITAAGPAYPSWPVMVLPHVDQQAVFDQWMSGAIHSSGTTMLAPQLSVFICPSAKRYGVIPSSPALHYAGNAGTGFSGTITGSSTQAADGTVTPGDGVMVDAAPRIKKPFPFPTTTIGSPFNDLFWCELATPQQAAIVSSGTAGPVIRQAMTPDFVNANDGLTNTLLFCERSGLVTDGTDRIAVRTAFWDGRYQSNPDASLPRMPWGYGLFELDSNASSHNYRGIAVGIRNNKLYGALPVPVFGFGFDRSVPSNVPAVINHTPNMNCVGAFPSSRHPGGAVTAFCDGRTLFLADSLARHVYAQLVTSSQNNSDRARQFLRINSTTQSYDILDEKDYQ